MRKFGVSLVAVFIYSITAFAQSNSIYPNYTSQAEHIYQQMSLDERIGQLLMPSYTLLAKAVSPNGALCKAGLQNPNIDKLTLIHDCGLDQIKKYHVGSVLTGGGPYYNAPTLENWAALNALAAEQHRFGSPRDPLLLTGNDTIHGNMHVQGAVIFPHSIGLGVTHNPKLISLIGTLVAEDSLASGFNWAFMPVAAGAQDLRWGRTYESFGQDPKLIKMMSEAYINGLQNIKNQQITGTLASVKHFIGDGATRYGLDEGDDNYQGDETNFWLQHGRGYEGAIDADIGSMMISFSAINGNNTRMHFGGKWDIINKFKNLGIVGSDKQTYRFNGLVVSDWNGPTRAAYFYHQTTHNQLTLPEIMAKSINSGVDILMSAEGALKDPFNTDSNSYFTNIEQVFDAVKSAYEQGLISDARLKNAVVRILTVKLALHPIRVANYSSLQARERKVALRAAEESLVLLKNTQHLLPINPAKIKNVVFIGDTNDLGIQNGGWTINWQGQKGNQYFTGKDKLTAGALTVEEAVQQKLGNAMHYYHVNNEINNVPNNLNAKDTIAIAIVAEPPYAEYMGDIGNVHEVDKWYEYGVKDNQNQYMSIPQSKFLGLTFANHEAAAISALKQRNIPVLTIVFSGRPVILTAGDNAAPFNNSNAVIAAFLPGTLGGKALANAIFGDYRFRSSNQCNTLTFPWPRNMEDVENHFRKGSLFPVGYGLSD